MNNNSNIEKKRETFSSGLAIFFATLGSAIGLGNIWRFPYVIGMNGGGAFLVTYLLCIIIVGIPIMIAEFYIGRKTRKNSVGAYEVLKPKSKWKGIGYLSVIISFLIMFFYSSVVGWVYSYVFKILKGDLSNITNDSTAEIFNKAITGTTSPILWQIIVVVIVSTILAMGVKKGIERITKALMPVLFILMTIIVVRAITLPGAKEGLNFLFNVDFSKLTGAGLITALGLAFFKLSLGLGCMTTYGSYFTEDNNMIGTSFKVAFSDTLVSLMAGIAIFPAVFSFNLEPGAGPGLLFITIPLVFSKIPLGNILLPIFFILTAIASTTSLISMLEVPVAFLTEEKGFSRKKAVIVSSVIVLLIGTLASLSADKGSLLGEFKILGKTFFDMFDHLSSNVLMPLSGLLTAIFIGYFTKKEDIKKELSNNGKLKMDKVIDIFYFVIRYITPLLVIIIFLNSMGIIKF